VKASVIRSISFPAKDFEWVQELAEEHGGLSQLFQRLYNAVLDHRREHGRDPEDDELTLALAQKKAVEEERAEFVARTRRKKHQERAAQAQERIEAKRRRKRERYPTPESIARDNAYATDDELRRLAFEYEHDAESVIQIAAAIRRAEERKFEEQQLPEPQTLEEHAARDASAFDHYPQDKAEQYIEREARKLGFDPKQYLRAARAAHAGQRQETLRVVRTPPSQGGGDAV
jgi:hypothetical protein